MLLSQATAQQLSLPIQRMENPFGFFLLYKHSYCILLMECLSACVCTLETTQYETRWQHGFAPTSSLITCFTHSTVHSNQLISSNMRWFIWPCHGDHLLLWPKLKLLPIVWRWKNEEEEKKHSSHNLWLFSLFVHLITDWTLDNDNGNWYNSNGHQACPMNWRNCTSPCEPNILTHSTR